MVSYSPILHKGQKRKDVIHDITREDTKELKPNSTNTSFSEIDVNANSLSKDNDKKTSQRKENSKVPVTAVLDSGIFLSNY